MVLAVITVSYVYKDYYCFLSLGPGGTPSNFYGYCKITLLRLVALSNPTAPAEIPAELENTGYLPRSGIPKRQSVRPNVLGIAPQRQMNQRPQQNVIQHLSHSLANLARDHPRLLKIATSSFEKHCPALYSNREVNITSRGEVAHLHSLDGSLHMTLHPEDAKTVIEAGWGERHPLARGGWCSRFVPKNFVMIYAPRTTEEVAVVMEIIKAGIGWVSGEAFRDDEIDNRQEVSFSNACIDGACGLLDLGNTVMRAAESVIEAA